MNGPIKQNTVNCVSQGSAQEVDATRHYRSIERRAASSASLSALSRRLYCVITACFPYIPHILN